MLHDNKQIYFGSLVVWAFAHLFATMAGLWLND